MSNETMWHDFTETGDPLYYLIYRSSVRERNKEKEQTKGKEIPASAPVS